jgi:hypothetical protein
MITSDVVTALQNNTQRAWSVAGWAERRRP